jgi:hypothetical protein
MKNKKESKKEDKIFDYQTICNINTSKEDRKKLHIGDIWSNQIKCKLCGDTIRSMNLHHYVVCKCGSVAADGGSWYAKRIGYLDNIEEQSVLFNNR